MSEGSFSELLQAVSKGEGEGGVSDYFFWTFHHVKTLTAEMPAATSVTAVSQRGVDPSVSLRYNDNQTWTYIQLQHKTAQQHALPSVGDARKRLLRWLFDNRVAKLRQEARVCRESAKTLDVPFTVFDDSETSEALMLSCGCPH